MAWNTLTYACGHTTREQLHGPLAQRERTIERALDRLCPDCYAAKLAADRAAESAAAIEAAKTAGLPTLTGSEKQIAWAEAIRTKQITSLNALDEKLANAPAAANAEAVRIGREIIAATIARTAAKEWIDSRDIMPGHDWLLSQVKARMAK